MSVFIRVDASTNIGTGHVMRCLSLADAIRRKGKAVSFICRPHEGNLIAHIQSQLFRVFTLPEASREFLFSGSDYTSWLGAAVAEDAEQTLNVLSSSGAEWLIVDHYGIDFEWEKLVSVAAKKLLVIDDLANRKHECSVLLDQNYANKGADRYEGLVPTSCRSLLGPAFALLKPEYAMHRLTMPERNGEVRKILISLGGADFDNVTLKVLEALQIVGGSLYEAHVVLGVNSPHKASIRAKFGDSHSVHLYSSLEHLALLMSECDIAIGAMGGTAWERMCLGLPTIAITIADNQLQAAQAMAASELIEYVGPHASLTVSELAKSIGNFINNKNRLREISRKNLAHVDGYGTRRVAEAMFPTRYDELVCVPFSERDNTNLCRNVSSGAALSEIARAGSFAVVESLESKKITVTTNQLVVGVVELLPDTVCTRLELWIDPAFDTELTREQLTALAANSLSANIFPDLGKPELSAYSKYLVINSSRETPESINISIISDPQSWMNKFIAKLVSEWLRTGHKVLWVHDVEQLEKGDICFYLSFGRIVPSEVLQKFAQNLVVHASNLPEGKGWSPLTWQILEGKDEIPVTLFEAQESVDSGAIYLQDRIRFEGTELLRDLQDKLGMSTLNLCERFVAEYPEILERANEQSGEETFYKRRRPVDSALDPEASLSSQFNLLRIVDNDAYPAYFEHRGEKYVFQVSRYDKER